MSIFVSIAAYCDPLLGFTMERASANASDPDALHFGVVDQSPFTPPPKYPRPAHLSYVRIDPVDARGPCWARALAMSFYAGEDWFLQIDSHMDFDPEWDRRLVAQAGKLMAGRAGLALSAYPNAFVMQDGMPVRKPVTDKVLANAVKAGQRFEEGHPVLKFEAQPVETDAPVPAFHLAAGCLFAPGRLANEFPYDPRLYFHGEEQALTLRLFTHGWDIFHPPGLPIHHLYGDAPGSAERAKHWDSAEDRGRAVKWKELEGLSRKHLQDLVSRAPLGVYGLGRRRSLADYAAFSGIDYARRSIAPHAYKPLYPPPARPASIAGYY
jgi:hypothetical protein